MSTAPRHHRLTYTDLLCYHALCGTTFNCQLTTFLSFYPFPTHRPSLCTLYSLHYFLYALPSFLPSFSALTHTHTHTTCRGGWKANLIHHAAALLCWSQLLTGGFAHFLGLIGIISEITTPFVNFRWFFDKGGMKGTTLYLVNGMTMTLLWFLVRILGFMFVGYRMFQMREGLAALSTGHQATVVLSYTVGYGLQWFWFYRIVKGALKALNGGGKGAGNGRKQQ